MKNIILAIALAATGSAYAADSYYVPDFAASDISGYDSLIGGTVYVPYNLVSGSAAGNLGSSFNVAYDVALSGVAGSGYHVPATANPSNLKFRPAGQGFQPTIGSQFSATVSIGGPVSPGAGWTLSSEDAYYYTSGYTGSTSNVIASMQTPFPTLDHGAGGTFVWDVSVGGLGLDTFISNTPRYDSRGFYFSGSTTNPESQTYMAFDAVPEPSGALLLAIAGAGFLGRRRRS